MINKKIVTTIVFISLYSFLASINIVFSETSQYTITVTARDGGKIIAPDGSEIIGPSTNDLIFDRDSTPDFNFIPDSSKHLLDVVLDSVSQGPITSLTLSPVTTNHEIIAVFSDGEIPINIPVSAGDVQIYSNEATLNQSFKDMISKGISYVSPVASVDEANPTQNGDEIYTVSFRPMDSGQWRGNLKKYGIAYLKRNDCTGRDEHEWTIVDSQITTDTYGTHGTIAVDCDGNFLASSISYWSSVPDGGDINEGGAGKLLLDMVPSIVTTDTDLNKYHSQRNIFTADSNGSIIPFRNLSNSDLGVDDDSTRYKIINYVYGYTYDSVDHSGIAGFPVEKRDWILGDIIHSEPEILDYFDPSTGNLQSRYIAVGSNDGMMHVFTDMQTVFGGRTYSPGDEIFAFVPRDLLSKLNEAATSTTHTYMVDGSPVLFRPGTTDANGYLNKILAFGERRGGRSYWALDITHPNPENWTVKWHIIGGSAPSNEKTTVTQEIRELGYSWSKPYFTKIKTGASTFEDIVIFAGGYDEIEDGFPEAFVDSSGYNGKWDTGEYHAATVGGTEGYDRYNPGADNYGRGIYIRKVSDGSALFSVTYNRTTNYLAGNAQLSTGMKYCFPADISVIPFSESILLIYAADIYGQIWKIKYDYNADTYFPFDSPLSTRWAVKRVFASNPGSSLASGLGTGLITPFTDSNPGTPGFDTTDQGRKTFYSPDISYTGNDWTNKPVLYFGTGDRAHPRYTMISNRFYAVADADSLTYETGLVNLTCDELDLNADADNDGEADTEDDGAIQSDLKALFYNNQVNGFYRIMDKQGNCSDGSSIDHTGEHILSQPVLFADIIYFTSYQPVLDDPGNPTGNTYIYALDYSFGTSGINYSINNDNDFDIRVLEDTFIKISGNSIPSDIELVNRGGHAAGLISDGGKISGVTDQKTGIPEPPGGISQMLWDVE